MILSKQIDPKVIDGHWRHQRQAPSVIATTTLSDTLAATANDRNKNNSLFIILKQPTWLTGMCRSALTAITASESAD